MHVCPLEIVIQYLVLWAGSLVKLVWCKTTHTHTPHPPKKPPKPNLQKCPQTTATKTPNPVLHERYLVLSVTIAYLVLGVAVFALLLIMCLHKQIVCPVALSQLQAAPDLPTAGLCKLAAICAVACPGF